MKIYLKPNGGGARLRCKLPQPDADRVVVQGARCACGEDPLVVQGTGKRPSDDDRAWEADAVSVCCGAHLGILRVEANTLFGVREDEAVMRSGIKVY